MERKQKTQRSRMARGWRRYFLAGILVTVPTTATILVMWWLFTSIDSILTPVADAIFGGSVTGAGFVLIVLLTFLAGVIVSNVVGRKAVRYGEYFMSRIWLARTVYTTVKQVIQTFSTSETGGFKEVVLVEFPRPGMKTVAFVTNRIKDSHGHEFVTVYVATTPNPTSGFMEIIPAEEVVPTDITVEQAMKMVISGGMVSPEII